MQRWLAPVACILLPAAAAAAEPMSSLGRPLVEAPKSRPAPDFRLVQQSPLDPAPIRESGMVMNTQVAPNTSVGIGLFKVTKRSGLTDWRPDNRAPKSRKIGIGLKMRF